MAEPLERLKAALADRYRIERELGAGGMATVYLAQDLRHDRKVAVKVLRPELAATLGPQRFLQEIQIAARLAHPHILPLYDSGQADGFLYYVMPCVEGESLREKLSREGELPVAEATRILKEVTDALAYAHGRGIIHRDIKPENVMLSGRHALVTDFGVAKALHEATGRQQLTTAGVALGTPAYMAPEQAAADPHVDHRADLYAVGAMGYELLTGRPPFMGASPQMVLAAHLTEVPRPVTDHRPAVPAVMAGTIMRCLEKKPADRWQTAGELLTQLEVLASTLSGGITPSQTQPVMAPGVASSKRFAAAVAVLVVLGLAAAGAAVRWWPGASHGPPAGAREPVVVVPFEVQATNPELAGLGARLAIELSDAITRSGLGRVVPYGGGPASGFGTMTPRIAEAIVAATGSATLITGTISERGDSFDVQTRLLRAADLKPLWTLRTERGSIRMPDLALSAATQRVLGAIGWYLAPAFRGWDVTLLTPPVDLEQLRIWTKAFERFLQTGGVDEETRALFLDVIRRDRSVIAAHLWLAGSYGNGGDGRRSDSILSALAPGRGRFAVGEARVYDWMVSLRRSPQEEYRAAAAGLASDSTGFLYQASLSSFRDGRLNEALGYYHQRDTTTVGAREWAVWHNLAIAALHRLGRFEESLALARDARTRHPDNYGHLGREAAELTALGRTDEAERLITQAYDYSPPLAPGALMAYSIAPELYAHGNPVDAQAMWRRALDWFEGRTLAGAAERNRRLSIARLYYLTGQVDRARPLFAELAKADPESSELAAYQGLIAAAAGDTSSARRLVTQLVTDAPGWLQGERLYWGARIYAVLGDRDQAVSMLRDALNHGARIGLEESHFPDWGLLKGYEPFEQLLKPKE